MLLLMLLLRQIIDMHLAEQTIDSGLFSDKMLIFFFFFITWEIVGAFPAMSQTVILLFLSLHIFVSEPSEIS